MKIRKEHIHQVSPYLWEIPKSFRPGKMHVPARIMASEKLLDDIIEDRSLSQLVNVASLPGIQIASMVMPDVHEGYGFPIGGVAATVFPGGAISPGGIGYDINCGVRLLISKQELEDVKPNLEELSKELYKQIPSGMGKGGQIQLSSEELNRVLEQGAEWAVENGYGVREDLKYIESNGKLEAADSLFVSEMAKKRGMDQLGTIGSGNHFVEVDYVEEVLDKRVARAFNLYANQIVILIHTGSRGLGHQVATDYIREFIAAMKKYEYDLPDRELASVPFNSTEGQAYYKAMCAAANYAWCNREIVSHEVRIAWQNIFGLNAPSLHLLYDVAHNIAKIETHKVAGEERKFIVHRKGATRAFGPGSPEIPERYQSVGQPVIIPGSMGTCSYVLAGTTNSSEISFGSCCHGAGRRLSRTASKKLVNAPALKEKLKEQGVYIEAGSFKGIAEEAPLAYKDVNLVVETIQQLGIAMPVAKLRPLVVIKG
jgi:tRNA-splicing ligase RtcB